MSSERSSSRISNRARLPTPGAPTWKESRYQLALHVRAISKANPNADAKPTENPIIAENDFLARTSIASIIDCIKILSNLTSDSILDSMAIPTWMKCMA